MLEGDFMESLKQLYKVGHGPSSSHTMGPEAACKFVLKKHPNLNKKVKGDYGMLKDVKHLFINTLATVLTNNIDIIIISKFVGLNYVVIYSTYNYFVEAL